MKHINKGGAFGDERDLYVSRATDQEFREAMSRPGSCVNIHGCRAMGKTSLYFRHRQALAKAYATVYADVAAQVVPGGPGRGDSAFLWVRRLAEALAANLGIEPAPLVASVDHAGPSSPAGTVLLRLFLDGLLPAVPRPPLLVLDEFDSIAELPYSEDLLQGFRSLWNMRVDYAGLSRVSICFISWRPMVQLHDPSLFVAPFAQAIGIEDFDENDETYGALRSAFPDQRQPDDEVLREVLHQSGRQPLTTMLLLDYVRSAQCDEADEVRALAARLVRQPEDATGDLALFHQIDRGFVSFGNRGYAALSSYESVLKGGEVTDIADGADLLLLAGIVRSKGRLLEPKGELFERCFDESWVARMRGRLASAEREATDRGRAATRARQAARSHKRILLINTGGTLGMVQRGGRVVAPADEQEYKDFFDSLDGIADVTYRNLFRPRDSINIFPEQWITIAECIYQNRHEGYDGIVVVHGTDTMADTASAVAFALGRNLSFPVVFTGAQTTPDVRHGDAHVNLYRACEVAKQELWEVVICFDHYVFRGVRAQKIDDRRFPAFASPTYPPLAEITGEVTVYEQMLRQPRPTRGQDIELRASFADSILFVPQFPGLERKYYETNLDHNEVKGIIIETRGAGNVASEPPHDFMPFVKRAYDGGIPVIVTSQYPPDPGSYTLYQPAQAPLEHGAIHAGNMTLAAATTKFRWVLADVLHREEWPDLSCAQKRTLVEDLLVGEPLVGEFEQAKPREGGVHS